jgi:methylated-DNA-[protein]-cysteine S-methyltransferase
MRTIAERLLRAREGGPAAFRQRVLSVVRRIPPGRVATYGDVANLAGRPRAWRAVGTIMRTCRDSRVPCHRVVAAGGRLGGYGGNEAIKAALLRAEGLTVIGTRIRRFRLVRWIGQNRGTRARV